MGKSSSKPKKPKMSKQEKVQHAAAAAEWDHYKRTYRPIEQDYLRDSQRDRSARAMGQSSNAVMREGTGALQLAALGGGTSLAGSAVGSALTEGRVNAAAEERAERDGRIAGALGIGRQLATDTTRSLSTLGRLGASTAINNMQNKLTVDSARSAARAQMVGAVGGAVAGGFMGGSTKAGGAGAPSVVDLRANKTLANPQSEWAPPLQLRR